MLAVLLVTLVCLVFGHYYIPRQQHSSYFETIGFRYDNLMISIISSIVLMIIFYIGPISCQICLFFLELFYEIDHKGSMKRRSSSIHPSFILREYFQNAFEQYSRIILFRNLVFAPITEEVVFRCLNIAILINEYPKAQIIWIAPLFFGVAHLHHMYNNIRSGMPIFDATIQSTLQLSYTYIFGVIASILLIETNNVFAPISSHVFCNYQGLPDISFMNKPNISYASSKLSCLYPWRYLFLVLHGLGLILFSFALYPILQLVSN